jgi:hypothetical protein
LECITSNKEPAVSGNDGVKATKIAQAAMASDKLGSAIFLEL